MIILPVTFDSIEAQVSQVVGRDSGSKYQDALRVEIIDGLVSSHLLSRLGTDCTGACTTLL